MSNKIEDVIVSRLTSDSGVTSITDRVFGGVLPPGEVMPAIVFNIGVGTTSPSKDQASEIDQGVFDLIAWSYNRSGTAGYTEAGSLIEAARVALDKVTGSVASVTVLNIEPIGTPEDVFNEQASDDGAYGKSQEFYYALTRT